MRLINLLEANYFQSIKHHVIDFMIALKIRGETTVPTDTVIKEFAKNGIVIDFNALVDVIGNESIVYDITAEEITLLPDEEDVEVSSGEKIIDDKDTVEKLAKKALKKRM